MATSELNFLWADEADMEEKYSLVFGALYNHQMKEENGYLDYDECMAVLLLDGGIYSHASVSSLNKEIFLKTIRAIITNKFQLSDDKRMKLLQGVLMIVTGPDAVEKLNCRVCQTMYHKFDHKREVLCTKFGNKKWSRHMANHDFDKEEDRDEIIYESRPMIRKREVVRSGICNIKNNKIHLDILPELKEILSTTVNLAFLRELLKSGDHEDGLACFQLIVSGMLSAQGGLTKVQRDSKMVDLLMEQFGWLIDEGLIYRESGIRINKCPVCKYSSDDEMIYKGRFYNISLLLSCSYFDPDATVFLISTKSHNNSWFPGHLKPLVDEIYKKLNLSYSQFSCYEPCKTKERFRGHSHPKIYISNRAAGTESLIKRF
ncbi:hypothetical protein [Melon chlorotic spot virus]|uniref:Uncharacterized protein n=1 Tax=Melon chlorotic spot virus TaxID=2479459 RepID=A0A3G1Z2Z8_9VIRU|nr:hypothetical protein [Melon chlorotic spot virus]AYL40767.1 hypothetical protein [Melon chlorotic spot virus]